MSEITTPDEKLPVEWVPRDDLVPNDWNPNSMVGEKRDELVQSILDNGWTQPIVRRAGTNEIVDGEQRWSAASDTRIADNEELTPDDVPAGYVPVFDLDAEQEQAMVATLQHNVATGDHDATKVGSLLQDLNEDGLAEDAADRMNIGDIGLRRLMDRAGTHEGDAPAPDEAFDIPWRSADEHPPDRHELDPDDEDEDVTEGPLDGPITERIDFLVTAPEADRVHLVLTDRNDVNLLMELCQWAIENEVHRQTRVDMRELADRPRVYDPAEAPIEHEGDPAERIETEADEE